MAIQRLVFDASLESQADDRYPRISFSVPEGAQSVGVRVMVSSPEGVVDIGCEGAAGWRGWSGGARRSFMISDKEATPGYVPGDLEVGEWYVILGLHDLPLSAVRIEIEVSIPSQVALIEQVDVEPLEGVVRGSSRGLPAEPGLTWFAGDFHSHTMHSDGALHIPELARLAVSNGLDFATVSDHNTVSHHAFLPGISAKQGITLIPGQEVTTHRGHANAFGDIGWIDFREPAQNWVDEVESRGGVLSINHALSGDCSWQHELVRKPKAVELWHSTWFGELISTAPLAWFMNWEHDVTLIGGSDFHKFSDLMRPGCPTTWVASTECTPEAILEGIKLGRTAITGTVIANEDGVLTPNILTCPALVRVGENLVAVSADGHVLVDRLGHRTVIEGDQMSWRAAKEQGPYVIVRPDRQIVAMSS